MATQLAARLRRTTGGLLIGGLALAFGWFLLDASPGRAQDGQPPRARLLLKSARELYARGEYESADAYYQQALLGKESLTPPEQRDLEAQLQQNATALRARREGLLQLQQAQLAMTSGRSDDAEGYLRLAQANQFLSPSDKQQLAGLTQTLGRLRAMPADGNGKSLLVRAREALAQGDLNTAETLANQAEKQRSIMAPLAFWSDSPGRVLEDIRTARSKMPAAAPLPGVIANYTPMPGMSPMPGMAGDPGQAQARAQARQLVLDGYKALEAGDLQTARRLGEQARDMRAGFDQWEHNPDNLLADVQRRTAAAMAMAGTGDARGMLRQARNLFLQQRLDEAEKIAVQAENMPNSRWGLFEDSPRKLRDEIVRARGQMDHDKASKLTLDARASLKRGDIAQARAMAQQAKALQGSSSIFTWNDTPDAVLRDVARAEKLHPQSVGNPNMPPPLPDGAIVQAPIGPNGLPLAPPPTLYSAEANNAAKMRAATLLVEARQLGELGHLPEARLKALEAEKIPAVWGPAEDCPGAVLRDLDTRASARIKHLLDQATDTILKNGTDPTRFEKADSYLLGARRLAETFRFDASTIDQKSQWIQQVANQSRLDPSAPAPTIRAAQAPTRSGQELSEPNLKAAAVKLEQARRELRAGDFELARKLAVEAYAATERGAAPALFNEANALLRTIDSEENAQIELTAKRNFVAAMEAYRDKNYSRSATLLTAIDLRLLPADQARRVEEIMSSPEMAGKAPRGAQTIVQTAATNPTTPAAPERAGRASVSDFGDPQIEQVRETNRLLFEKYRQKKLSAEYLAEQQWKAGNSSQAIDTLTECMTQLKTSGMETDQIERLTASVDKRVNDIRTAQAKLTLDRERELATKNKKWDENAYQDGRRKTQEQIAELIAKGSAMYKEGKYEDALVQANLVLELEPDNQAGGALKLQTNLRLEKKVQDDSRARSEENFLRSMPNSGDDPIISDHKPYNVDIGVQERARNRGIIESPSLPIKSAKELAIERKLSQPITLNVLDQPLYRVLQDLQNLSGINIVPDTAALADKGVSLEQSMSLNVDNISLKSALTILLRQVRLTYIIRDEVISITTTDNVRGKNRVKPYPVADLVVNNVPDKGATETNSFEEALKRHIRNGSGGVSYNAPTPYTGFNSLQQGQPVSSTGSGAGYSGGGKMAGGMGTEEPGSHIQGLLINLIQNTIAPETWESQGGEGRIQYFPLGHVLVVSQVQEVQEDVKSLLDALRKLQDIQISIEMRVVAVSESFFEKIGLDFDVNIRTNNNPNAINQLLVGNFGAPGQINRNLGVNGVVSGLGPGGNLTPDLSIPINSTSSQFSVPPFGGFPGTLAGDGGLSLGLAFLSDIQVFMFLEAAQGDRRTHIMQAPKITVFNGQTANINVQDVMFFLTGVAVVQAGSQTFFVPQNNPFPIGVGMTVTPVVSADRRFVRVNLQPQLTNLISPNIPLIPVQIPLPQLFDNVGGTGAIAGQPVIFQMFFQQPAFTTIQINTTVNVPDGGTVLLGGMKTLAEGRNEFGPPILSKIPYLSRLFRNTAFGRDTQSIMILVTPRIIINEEITAEIFGEIAPIQGAR